MGFYMHKHEYEIMNKLEESLFWFQVKKILVQKLIRKYIPNQKGTWLDIGCGTGGLTKTIETNSSFQTIGMDSNPWAVKYASKRIGKIHKGSAEALPYANQSIQAASFFDVLYHKKISSVENCLNEASRVLCKGGLLLITDCAYSFLSGRHDKYVQGARRFTLKKMINLLGDQQFNVLWSSYFFSWLLPAAMIKRIFMDRLFSSHHSDVAEMPNWANNLFLMIGKCELFFLNYIDRLPFGLSLVILAKKK